MAEEGARVLLAGGSPAMARARDVLVAEGIGLRAEPDGRAALGVLQQSAFDLVLADRHMPRLDAVGLCEAARERETLAGVQVVVLAATGERVDDALAAGADDYVPAPFEPPELLARVRRALRMAQLGASETRLQALMALVPGAVYRCALDRDWTMELISQEIEVITGYPAPQFVQSSTRSYASVIHPDDRDDVERAVADATDRGQPFSLEYRIVRADGTTGCVLERGELVRGGGGRVWLDGAIFDLTARKRTEDELRATRAREAADAERGRIARELHDSVSQALFSMTLHARAAELGLQRAGLEPDQPAARNVAQLRDLTQGALAEMRALIFELRPGALRAEGLIAALRKQAGALSAREGLAILVVSAQERWDLDAGVEEDLYRLVLEALHNVVKHAAATGVRVWLHGEEGSSRTLAVEVADDGCGFDSSISHPGHLGLASMRERADRAGGRFELDTAPGDGTTVRVVVPLANKADRSSG